MPFIVIMSKYSTQSAMHLSKHMFGNQDLNLLNSCHLISKSKQFIKNPELEACVQQYRNAECKESIFSALCHCLKYLIATREVFSFRSSCAVNHLFCTATNTNESNVENLSYSFKLHVVCDYFEINRRTYR